MKDARTTQAHMVRKHLDMMGYITKNDASAMRIGNVNDVIMRLRRSGMGISTRTYVDGSGRKFVRYERIWG